MNSVRPKIATNKITIFIIGSALITAVLIIRLFQLQVLQHDYYQEVATRSQYGFIELPAQRGEIIISDYHSGEEFALATNTTLNLLYADPSLIKDPFFITTNVGPLIFDIEEERAKNNERREELGKNLPADIPEEEKNALLKPLTDPELEKKFKEDLTSKLSETKRKEILMATDLEPETVGEINSLNLVGIEIKEGDVYAYPPQISQISYTAEKLAPLIEIPTKKLETVLKGENRYVVLKRKLDPEISQQIEELMDNDTDDMYLGLGMKEEYFRFYPEESLAANIVGYVNHDNVGQYGIESSFNSQLQGKTGKLHTKKDSVGRQITVGESELQAAKDGDDIVLTIDRSIQMYVENVLEEAVTKYRADSGQILIMNPKTGGVIAMVHYPSFDPNNYGEVFKKEEIYFTPEQLKELYPTKDEGVYSFYVNPITLDQYLVFEEKDENGNSHYFRYVNLRGPEVYHNKIVSWPYEPGSVFKTVAMSIAIDDGDVTPNTTYNDTGPIEVDYNVYSKKYDFTIKNSTNKYFGLINMKTVLAKSLNTGMTFVAKKIGPALFYNYLEKFGFLDRTDIEFDGESKGKIEYFEDWSESELATHAFGQGITVTMIQLASAYSAIVNGGVLMQPHIIEEIRHDDGTVTKTDQNQIRRVISEDTSAKMVAMLVNAVENGEANQGSVKNHYVGGKTGTSQTYKHGEALSGSGTTIASFAGFGPITDPQFVVLIKLDHPRENEWGSQTAAPTFKKIAEYLFDYYNIPPDR